MKKVDFLPVSKEDMDKRGWKQLDFLYIVGDAYVDHPSFGHAIISRVLESHGYKVGIVALPDWHKIDDFVRMGRPKLGVLVSAGNIDSMVNHYTAKKNADMTICMHPAERAVCVPTEPHLCIVTELKKLSAQICRYLSAELRQVLEDLLIMIIGTIRLDVRFYLTLVQVF